MPWCLCCICGPAVGLSLNTHVGVTLKLKWGQTGSCLGLHELCFCRSSPYWHNAAMQHLGARPTCLQGKINDSEQHAWESTKNKALCLIFLRPFSSRTAPKWFDGQRSTENRQGTLAEYCYTLINLPHKISRCLHVVSFFKVRHDDMNPVTDSQ